MDIYPHFEESFNNKRITIMGLGLFGGGVGVARFLVERGAEVTVTDKKGEDELQNSITQLSDLPITFHLGGHREEDFRDVDMVIVNPAVPKTSEYLKVARENGVPLEYEMNLFFRMSRTPIIGVTGSNGKSTVVALIGEMLKAAGRNVWVGGNIGKSLLQYVDEISEDDIVVLELSSFQLEDLQSLRTSPHISVITNISMNHLDRHGTMENYIEIKKGIIKFQGADDYAILNFDDPILRNCVKECPGKYVLFSGSEEMNCGAFLRGTQLFLRLNCTEVSVSIENVKIAGKHNLSNITAASAAAFIAGANGDDIQNGLSSFSGLEHRIELVREIGGVKYYNDSVATTPESVIAALRTFESPIILIAGGSDKKLPFNNLAKEIVARAKLVILLGETAAKIRQAIISAGKATSSILEVSSLSEAVHHAKERANPGDIVLLSPSCASYGMFDNYADRGNQFKALVNQLTESQK